MKRPRFRVPAGGLTACLCLLLLGSVVAAYKISIARPIRYIGHGDSAAYATMGVHLAEGRGLQVDYVSWFFIPYPPTITHREDHWPPFLGFVTAPFVLLLGSAAWVCKLPPILIGSIGLPLAAAALGMAFSRRSWVGLAAGLLMLANVPMFTASLRVLSDVPNAMLVAGFSASLLGSARRPRLHILSGFFLAMAYYSKGSTLVLILLYPPLAVLACGWRVVLGRWFWLAVATVSVLIIPWFVSNTVLYGNPRHSTQNYVSAFKGLAKWEQNTYYPYWGKNLPKTSDRWRKHAGEYTGLVARNREDLTRYALLGPSAKEQEWKKFGQAGVAVRDGLLGIRSKTRARPASEQGSWITRWREPTTVLSGILSVVFVAVLALYSLTVLPAAVFRRWRRERVAAGVGRLAGARALAAAWRAVEPPLLRPTLVLLVIAAVQWAFIVYLWGLEVTSAGRLAFVFLPTTAVLACTAVSKALEAPLRWFKREPGQRTQDAVALGLAALALAGTAVFHQRLLQAHHANTRMKMFPYADYAVVPKFGDWLKANLPDAVVMTRFPWQITFHAGPGNKAVNIPWAPPETIFAIARYYGVTHYLADTGRPGMEAYTKKKHPGFVPVEGAPGRLFELKYEHLPGGTATATDLPIPVAPEGAEQ